MDSSPEVDRQDDDAGKTDPLQSMEIEGLEDCDAAAAAAAFLVKTEITEDSEEDMDCDSSATAPAYPVKMETIKIEEEEDGEGSGCNVFPIKTEGYKNMNVVKLLKLEYPPEPVLELDLSGEAFTGRSAQMEDTHNCIYRGCFFIGKHQQDLHDHLVKKHGESSKVKTCAFCPFSTSSNVILTDHISQVHLPAREKVFKCSYAGCNYSCLRRPYMITHKAKKHGEKTSDLKKCPHCEYTTAMIGVMKKHIETHLPLDERSIKCGMGDCTFCCHKKTQLLNHIARVHEDLPFTKVCPHCDFEAESVLSWKTHIKTHLPALQCSFNACSSEFTNSLALSKHLVEIHQDTSHLKQCPYCDYTTPFSGTMKNHIDTHMPAEEKPFKCTYKRCKYACCQMNQLYRHLSKKHGDKAYKMKKCPHCSYTTFFGNMKAHLESHLTADGKSIKCPREGCPYTAGRKELLRRHLAKKHRLKHCPHCKFATECPKTLKTHIQTHGIPEEKPFNCGYEGCGFSCTRQERYKNHLANEHGESYTVMKCPHCEFLTPSSVSYKAHLAHEHGESFTLKQCPHCEFFTPSAESLKIHVQSHGNKPVKCTHDGCSYSCTRKDLLHNHLAQKHGDRSHLKQCPQCEYSTASTGTLKKHIETHLPPDLKSFKCTYPECSYSCSLKLLLTNHLAKKHGETSHLRRCPYCDFSSPSLSTLKKHIQTHLPSDSKAIKCTYTDCTYSCSQKQLMYNHLNKKHGETAHLRQCPYCEYSTASGSLKKHLETHLPNDQRSIKCTYQDCTFTCSHKNHLKNHLVKAHGETAHLLPCPYCDYSTASGSNLKKHVETHLGSDKKSYKCTVEGCGYSCSHKHHLTSHMAIKHGDKSNLKKCPDCEFTTANPGILKKHVETHLPSDSKSLKCRYDECNYSCSQKHQMYNHLAKHHGETSHLKQCPYCEYQTAFGKLNLHIQTHLPPDQKLFKCSYDQCGYSCARKQLLNNHLAKQHGETSNLKTCAYCDFTSVSNSILKVHMKTHDAYLATNFVDTVLVNDGGVEASPTPIA